MKEYLRSLYFGREVEIHEIQGYKYWARLCAFLSEKRIRYIVHSVGYGMHVNYQIRIDGRSLLRFRRIMDVENLWV